jgi:hypothetical protein
VLNIAIREVGGTRPRRSGAQEADMQGIETGGPEEAFRRGYEHAALRCTLSTPRAKRSPGIRRLGKCLRLPTD